MPTSNYWGSGTITITTTSTSTNIGPRLHYHNRKKPKDINEFLKMILVDRSVVVLGSPSFIVDGPIKYYV